MDRDAVLGADRSPRVTAAAGPQSNFPACRSARGINKSHSWLLCRGRWSLYCSSKTNVGSGQDTSYFQGQKKTTQTHTSTSLTRPTTQLSPFLSLLSFITLQNSHIPDKPPLFFLFYGMLYLFHGGNFNNSSATESIESWRPIPKFFKAHSLFIMPRIGRPAAK